MANKKDENDDKKNVFFIAVTDKLESKNRAYSNFVLNLCKSSIVSDPLNSKVDVNSFAPHYQLCTGNIKQSLFNNLVKYNCFVILLDDINGAYNPNVWFELGVVSTMNCSMVLIASEQTPIPFDSNDISVVRISNELMHYFERICDTNAQNMRDIHWVTKIRELNSDTSTEVEHKFQLAYSNFSINFKNILKSTLKEGNPFNSLYDNAKIKSLGFNGLYDMLVKTRMINLLESNGVTAEYISGEKAAFEELAREVRKAKHSLRTTRFANQSIVATEIKQFYADFMNALYEASHNVDTCYRIICNNNYLKWHDIYEFLKHSSSNTKVFVRKEQYSINFELVIIDEVIAFIHFYQTMIIDDVTLSLDSGNVYGLCGYNGCGKTMLMRLIAGLIIPTTGKISFDGKILGKDIDFPESMGILIENPAFLSGLTGFDNLKLLSSIKKEITEEVITKTITRVGLNPKDKKKYRKYSLGMKQRLGIASAIMESPKLIILDEPTNALDSDGVDIAKKIIAEERDRGALVIVTCHERSILEEISDVIYSIEHGRIIEKIISRTEGEVK